MHSEIPPLSKQRFAMTDERQVRQVAAQALGNRKLVMHRSFFGYLYDIITHTSLYAKWQSLLSILRRVRAVSIALKLSALIFSILETGTLVILSAALFLLILPIGLFFTLVVLLIALLKSRRTTQHLSTALENQTVYVLFLHEGDPLFQLQNARELATRGAVLLVSPYWILAKGLHPHGFYCTARRETSNIYLVRRYYFFSLRRHLLDRLQTVYLY